MEFFLLSGITGSLQANSIKNYLDLKDDLNNNILIFNSLDMTVRKTRY